MSTPASHFEIDPAVVLIPETEPPKMTMDEWLASLKEDGPTEPSVTGAELLAQVRSETE